MEWYKVTKTIKGRPYLYWQKTRRDGRRIKTQNRYIGPCSDAGMRHRTPPPVFYHGTLNTFDTFDPSKRGDNTDWDNARWGFFFLDDPKRAAAFVDDTRMPGDTRPAVVMRVHLDIKKPLDLTIHGVTTNKAQAPVIYEAFTGEKLRPDEALEILSDSIDLGTVGEFYEELYRNPEAKALFERAGYDGVISEFGREDGEIVKEYVAFNPHQIRKVQQ